MNVITIKRQNAILKLMNDYPILDEMKKDKINEVILELCAIHEISRRTAREYVDIATLKLKRA